MEPEIRIPSLKPLITRLLITFEFEEMNKPVGIDELLLSTISGPAELVSPLNTVCVAPSIVVPLSVRAGS